jgi:hypothetical protein
MIRRGITPNLRVGPQIVDLKGLERGRIDPDVEGLGRVAPDRNPMLGQAEPGRGIDLRAGVVGTENSMKAERSPLAQRWCSAKLVLFNVKPVKVRALRGCHGGMDPREALQVRHAWKGSHESNEINVAPPLLVVPESN